MMMKQQLDIAKRSESRSRNQETEDTVQSNSRLLPSFEMKRLSSESYRQRSKSTPESPKSFDEPDKFRRNSEEWEFLPANKDNSADQIYLSELIGVSEILTENHRTRICKYLPARVEGNSWTLIYSTSKHGFSLKTLYREMGKYSSPVIIVIEDSQNAVFGAVTSCTLHPSEHFYGSGETFLFTFYPEFSHFHWTGDNLFFIKGNAGDIAVGAGDGNFGLWLDGDLFHGRSRPCKTFDNRILSPAEDFVVKSLECWGFV